LTSHLKEISEDLNKYEVEFGQQKIKFEEEIISLKSKLEEAKNNGRINKYPNDEKRKKM